MTDAPLIQTILDIPELQQYYHVDVLPERSPLVLVLPAGAGPVTGLEKFGKPVVVADAPPTDPEAPFFHITEIARHGETTRVAFTYAVEGVLGHALLMPEDGGWTTLETWVAER